MADKMTSAIEKISLDVRRSKTLAQPLCRHISISSSVETAQVNLRWLKRLHLMTMPLLGVRVFPVLTMMYSFITRNLLIEISVRMATSLAS